MTDYDFTNIQNVYFLGAGASVGAGIPAGGRILADIFKKEMMVYEDPKIRGFGYWVEMQNVQRRIRDLYSIYQMDNLTDDIPTAWNRWAEELDRVNIDFEDYLSKDFVKRILPFFKSSGNNREEKSDQNLMKLIHWYFWTQHNEPKKFGGDSSYIKQFISHLKPSDTVLTINIDLALEEHDASSKLVYKSGDADANKNLYLKLHGSVNWIARWNLGNEISRFVVEDGIERQLEAIKTDQLAAAVQYNEDKILLLKDFFLTHDPNFEFAFIPPTLYKGIIDRTSRFFTVISNTIWKEAGECLKQARNICFIGTSLRETDNMLQVFLAEGIRNNQNKPNIILVDPNPNKEVISRFKKIMKIDMVWTDRFEDIVNSDKFKKIFHNTH